jgi:UDP-N-acetylmuramoyl-tripeptide--D-alanyl-D-alanine ligase
MIEDLAIAGVDCNCLQYVQGNWHESIELNVSFSGAEIDSRQVTPGCLFIGLIGENVDGSKYAQQAFQDGAIIALTTKQEHVQDFKAVDGATLLQVDDTARAMLALAKSRRQKLASRVIAITGTNGKTTTKDLLSACLADCGKVASTSGNFNNEIGLPLTLLRVEGDEDFVIVEMGASASGDIAMLSEIAQPDCGIITNASGAHLEGFGSLETIIDTKGELIDYIPDNGFIVLNRDENGFEQWSNRARGEVISFSENGEQSWSWADQQLSFSGQKYNIPLPGKYNGCNFMSALLVAQKLECSVEKIRSGLADFAVSAHRGKLIVAGDIQLFDDCYNANPASVLTAAEAVKQMSRGRTIAILGFMAELGNDSESLHISTGKQLYDIGIDVLIGVGEKTGPLVDGFLKSGGSASICSDQNAAANWLKENKAEDDLVLIKGSRSSKMELVIDGYLELINDGSKGVAQ